jgi:drug/metabolite transporter (DMT)-like permease
VDLDDHDHPRIALPLPLSSARLSRPGSTRAAFGLCLSSLLFAVMAVSAKLVAPRIPGPQAALVRFVLGVAVTALAFATGRAVIRPRRWGWLVARGFFGGISVMCYFACIERVPVGVATLLNQTQPIYTLIFAWLLIAERPPRIALVALPLTLIGTALIIGVRARDLHAATGELLGVISAISSGVAVTSVRAARRDLPDGLPSETAWSVFFSFTTLGALLAIPSVTPPLGHWVGPTGREWFWLAVMGGAGVAAQVVMTDSLRHLKGATAGIISQLTVLFAVAGGAIVFGDRVNLSFLAGAAMTLAGVAITVLSASPRLVGKLRIF